MSLTQMLFRATQKIIFTSIFVQIQSVHCVPYVFITDTFATAFHLLPPVHIILNKDQSINQVTWFDQVYMISLTIISYLTNLLALHQTVQAYIMGRKIWP